MDFGKDTFFWRFKWHSIVIYVSLIIIVLLTVFTNIFRTSQGSLIPEIVWFLLAVMLLASVVAMLSKTPKILDVVSENAEKLEKMNSLLEKNRETLGLINQNTRLSDAAKAIASRDVDKQTLREVVFDKLQQQDFDTTNEIIDEIAKSTVYKDLAVQLRIEAERYRGATKQERINQVIAHIENLFVGYQWANASEQIEKLIQAEPDSEKAKAMRQRLLDKKAERKRILLTAWDDAVKRQATDRSLEILKELDQYLTPNEGLALQEAARDVFRNKLHNLGVQFSLAVSEKHWAKAFDTGQRIMQDFPNSRMAEEIRERLEILKQKAQQQPITP
jgi:hypothetical protein